MLQRECWLKVYQPGDAILRKEFMLLEPWKRPNVKCVAVQEVVVIEPELDLTTREPEPDVNIRELLTKALIGSRVNTHRASYQ